MRRSFISISLGKMISGYPHNGIDSIHIIMFRRLSTLYFKQNLRLNVEHEKK